MPTVNVREFEQSFVIYFGTELPRVNAYTLAATLTSFADAARAANAIINPGYEVEVVVEALGAGSFKAKVRTVYRGAANLFSGENLRSIVLGVIASFVYQHTLAPDAEITVNVTTDEVVIEQGDKKVIVPREVHDAVQQVERSPEFRKGVSRVMRAVDEDPSVNSFGFARDFSDPKPPIEIPRDRFLALPEVLELPNEDTREIFETADLQVVRAILERSKRRWEFVWNGIRISAPVLDQEFYDRFFAREISLAPGDKLHVRLRVRQRRDPDIGIFINESYEVVEVFNHKPVPEQSAFDL
jgi:hypothetical protein